MTTAETAATSESHDAVSQRAADYFERRRFASWNETDQAELDVWLAEAVAHRVAYLRVEGIAARTAHLASLRPSEPAQVAPAPIRKIPVRRFAIPLLAAASIAFAALLGIPYVNSLLQPPDRTYATDVGGHAVIKFADRSQIELNTDTVVRFRMTGEERTVWLERGEAWFHVSHDASRPFNVIVGRHRVTDLGTEFLVRRGADDMEVALLAGRAALSTESAQSTILSPGDDAIATRATTTITKKTPQQLADALAWRHGMLVFRNARLADAVREFNRYNQTKLVIADPSIAGLKFSVEIQNDNFDDFLQLAQTVLRLRVDREGNDVLLYRGEPRARKAGTAP